MTKFQIPNSKFQTMQSKHLEIGKTNAAQAVGFSPFCSLELVWNLEFGIWNFPA